MEKLTIGAIWQGMLAALRADFGVLFAVAAPFTLLVSMVVTLYGPPLPTKMADFTPKVAVLLFLLPSLFGAIAQLAVTALVAAKGMSPRAALLAALQTLPVYFAAVLLITPVTTLGLVLLILPGLYVFARMYLLGAVVVVERAGPIAALRRSWDLTAANGGTILLFLVLGILFAFGASILAGGVGAAIGLLLTALGLKSLGGFATALVAATVSTLFTMASAAAGAVIYRRIKAD